MTGRFAVETEDARCCSDLVTQPAYTSGFMRA
jgi:hypothetical protein